MLNKLIAVFLSLHAATAFAAPKLTGNDFKSLAQITAAGGTAANLLGSDKVYDVKNGQQLSVSISQGKLGGSGGAPGSNLFVLDTAANSYATTYADDSNFENSIGRWLPFQVTAAAVPAADMTGGSASVTCARTTSSPLNGAASALMSVAAGATAQGQGCSDLIQVPPAYRGQPLAVSVPYSISGTYSSGDIIMYGWDTTNNVALAPVAVSNLASGSGIATAVFNVPATTAQMRFGFYVARAVNTTALSLTFDDVGASSARTFPAQINVGTYDLGSVLETGGTFYQSVTSFTSVPSNGGTPVYTARGGASASTGISITIPKVPAGRTKITLSGALLGSSSSNAISYFRMTDGTNFSNETPVVSNAGTSSGYPSASAGIFYFDNSANRTNVTFTLQCKASAGGCGVAFANTDLITLNAESVPTASTLAGALITQNPVTSIAATYAATLTRVTTTPTQLGQYRAMYRTTANSNTLSDTAPATAPTATNGFQIYASTYGSVGTSGQASHYEIYVGPQQSLPTCSVYAGTGFTQPLNIAESYTSNGSSTTFGTNCQYDVNTGVMTVDAAIPKYADTTRLLGNYIGAGGSGNASASSGYFDIKTFSNPLAAGLTPSTDVVRVYGANGKGGSSSGDTSVINFASVADQRGSNAIYVPRTATTGDLFKAGSQGGYCVSAATGYGAAVNWGISVNADSYTSTSLNASFPSSFILQSQTTASNGIQGSLTWCGPLNAGDRVRIQGDTSTAVSASNQAPTVTFWRLPDPFSPVSYPGGGTGNVYSAGGSERVERVAFGGSTVWNSQCTASPCTIWSQSGNWISSVTRTGTGAYTVNIASGIFSSPPTCTTGAAAGAQIFQVAGGSTSTLTISSYNSTNYSANDAGMNIICQGPRGSN